MQKKLRYFELEYYPNFPSKYRAFLLIISTKPLQSLLRPIGSCTNAALWFNFVLESINLIINRLLLRTGIEPIF